jgi:hypothetical protein
MQLRVASDRGGETRGACRDPLSWSEAQLLAEPLGPGSGALFPRMTNHLAIYMIKKRRHSRNKTVEWGASRHPVPAGDKPSRGSGTERVEAGSRCAGRGTGRRK